MQIGRVATGILWALCLMLPATAQVAPAEHLGHAVGADFKLPDWTAISSWYRDLDAKSPRVALELAGRTTEGRDFFACVISSEANMARLDGIRADARAIADPRKLTPAAAEELLARAVPVVMISIAMHSNEVAAPQFAMELAWNLSTSEAEPWKSMREKSVVVLLPCTNPDGLDMISHWYTQSVGKSYEAGSMPWLYQPYAGHDNNRDWFMLSLEETRIVSKLLYERWFPQVYWDVHQQGSFAERMFVPPFRDPLDPNLDPNVMGTIDLIGTRAALDMTSRGLKGIASGVSYDMWWHGGNRNVPVRHNIVGLLTEAASANLASPLWIAPDRLRAPSGLARYAPSNRFRDPWPGGWWRIRDIIDYELGFATSLFSGVVREPQLYTRTVLEAARRTCALGEQDGAPAAWVIPAENRDGNAVVRLCESLLRTGVEIKKSTNAITADGRSLAPGALVIARGQPAWRHVHDLFEIQAYPGDEPPYDVAGWSLPTLMGIEAIAATKLGSATADSKQDLPLDPPAFVALTRSEEARTPRNSAADEKAGDVDAWRALFAGLERGTPGGSDAGSSLKSGAARWSVLPRIAVYKPWTASMDEGWLRWTLEYCGLKYVSVDNARLKSGDLKQLCDVLVLPDLSSSSIDEGHSSGGVPEEYAGGLEREGRQAIEAFVRGGGRLVAVGRAAGWAIELFQLPLKDVARGKDSGDFSCPGSVLRARLEHTPGDPLSPASSRMEHLFFSGSSAWAEAESKSKDGPEVTMLATYAASDVLHSGWIRSPAVVAGKGAWARADVDMGRVHLFAFSPYYRSWSQGTFHWLLRAIMDTRQK